MKTKKFSFPRAATLAFLMSASACHAPPPPDATGSRTAAAVTDTRFTESLYASVPATANGGPTGIAWAPDGSGRLFWTKQDGTVRIIRMNGDTGTPVAAPVLTIPPGNIRVGGEEGLLSLAFDPGFMDNGFLYVYVGGYGNAEIVRYRVVGDTATERTVLITGLPGGGNHNGGGIQFGPDGKLYWAIGDTGDAAGSTGLDTFRSKVGRMNLDGTAPNDNPWFDGSGPNNDYAWARGFRNPFSMTFQPSTGELWLSVVGQRREQIFLVQRGINGGWDGSDESEKFQSGANTPAKIGYPSFGAFSTSIASASRSGNVTTITTSAPHEFKVGMRVAIVNASNTSFNVAPPGLPVTSVPSPTTLTFGQTGANATSTGGEARSQDYGNCVLAPVFYEGTAFPPEFRGNLFWGDYGSGKLWRAQMAPESTTIQQIDQFTTATGEYIDAAVGPDGALYYANYSGEFYRVAYNSTTQNIIVSETNIRLREGGRRAITVSLATAPSAALSVSVARLTGDPDIRVVAGQSLVFTPANWRTPQPVVFEAVADTDSTQDTATFSVSSAGLPSHVVTVKATDNDAQALLVSTAVLNIDEGATGTFTVALARPPAGTVVVGVARTAGDGDVTITSGATLTFTPANFASPQTVTVAAAGDADAVADTATLSISATGLPTRTVSVVARDLTSAPPAFVSIPVTRGVAGAPYNYKAAASGFPAPTFAFASTPPAGMTINATTGAITWTPPTTGAFPVSIRAANGVLPNATQSFTITVNTDTPPLARISAPTEGARISGKFTEFYGDGEDDVGTVRAEFYVDGGLRYTDTNATGHYHFGGAHALFDTTALTNGPHRLRMVVYDTKGQSGLFEVNVDVANTGGGPPAVPALAGPRLIGLAVLLLLAASLSWRRRRGR